jgi:hypothetical protein
VLAPNFQTPKIWEQTPWRSCRHRAYAKKPRTLLITKSFRFIIKYSKILNSEAILNSALFNISARKKETNPRLTDSPLKSIPDLRDSAGAALRARESAEYPKRESHYFIFHHITIFHIIHKYTSTKVLCTKISLLIK